MSRHSPRADGWLQSNLKALAQKQSKLVERLGYAVSDQHIARAADGSVQYRHQGSLYPLALSEGAVTDALRSAPSGDDSLVFGLGLGELLAALLARKGGQLWAWERDPFLLRLLLSRRDFSPAIRSGRLTFLLASDVVDLARDARPRARVFHPLLARLYHRERELLEQGLRDKRAYVCAGGLFVDDLSRALSAEGYTPLTLDLSLLSTEELRYGMRKVRPALIASINYPLGLSAFAAENACPALVWEVDPTVGSLPEGEGHPGTKVFTYREASMGDFRRAGFSHVEYLPLAADPEHRAPPVLSAEDRTRYQCDVSFVGSSMVDQVPRFEQDFLRVFAAARPGDATRGPDVLGAVLRAQRLTFERYVVPEALRALCADLPDAARAALERSAGEIASAEKRISYLARLGKSGVHVWGDAGWQVLSGTGANFRGPAGHTFELNRIYGASRINIDVGRLYQSDIVTMRVFDILACGGMILVEHSPALAALFEVGREVDSYRTLPELSAKISHYLAHPDEAQAMAERGRAAVLARHTVAQRVRHMLNA